MFQFHCKTSERKTIEVNGVIIYYVQQFRTTLRACLPLLFTKVVDYILCALSITHNPSYMRKCVYFNMQPLDDALSLSLYFTHTLSQLNLNSMCLRYLFLFSLRIYSLVRSFNCYRIRPSLCVKCTISMRCIFICGFVIKINRSTNNFCRNKFSQYIFNANETRQPVIQSANVRVP